MNTDDVLEVIASRLESDAPHLLDMRGIMAKRKRDREDAELRMNVRVEQRRELADWIRSFKAEAGNSYHTRLQRILENKFAFGPDVAAALANGHAELTVSVSFDKHLANIRPVYSIALTENGLAALEQNKAKT